MVNRDRSEMNAVISKCHTRGFRQDIIHVSSVAEAGSLAPPVAIVSGIPDFPPQTEEEKVTRGVVKFSLMHLKKALFFEMCYHPSSNSKLDALARGYGWQAIMGTEAMIAQGPEQVRMWSGIELKDLPQNAARTAVGNVISREQKL